MIERSKCVILVPTRENIEKECELGLYELQRMGYHICRLSGVSDPVVGRNEGTHLSLSHPIGFEELMWIDSDEKFNPESVDLLRSHGFPFVCATYVKKDFTGITADMETKGITFGAGGGLHEARGVGFGFTLTHRCVYDDIRKIRESLGLPEECISATGTKLFPYFMPMFHQKEDGLHYFGEDLAFCERAKAAGYKIMCDTSIVIGHMARYPITFQDVNNPPPGAPRH